MIGNFLSWILYAYFLVLIATALLSWFPTEPGTTTFTVKRFLNSITDPVIAPVRRLIPPVGIGGTGIDIAFMVVSFGVLILAQLVKTL
jgi:YggT family protein